MTNWNVELVARIAAAIKQHRESTSPKITAAQLSARTAELGQPISRAVISDLETGRKKTLDISELIVLAKALGVPPLQLIYPDLPDGKVEVWPGLENRSFQAAQWFSGEDRAEHDAPIVRSRQFYEAVRQLKQARLDMSVANAGARKAGESDYKAAAAANFAYWVDEVAHQAIELEQSELIVNVSGLPAQVRERIGQLRQNG